MIIDPLDNCIGEDHIVFFIGLPGCNVSLDPACFERKFGSRLKHLRRRVHAVQRGARPAKTQKFGGIARTTANVGHRFGLRVRQNARKKFACGPRAFGTETQIDFRIPGHQLVFGSGMTM